MYTKNARLCVTDSYAFFCHQCVYMVWLIASEINHEMCHYVDEWVVDDKAGNREYQNPKTNSDSNNHSQTKQTISHGAVSTYSGRNFIK